MPHSQSGMACRCFKCVAMTSCSFTAASLELSFKHSVLLWRRSKVQHGKNSFRNAISVALHGYARNVDGEREI